MHSDKIVVRLWMAMLAGEHKAQGYKGKGLSMSAGLTARQAANKLQAGLAAGMSHHGKSENKAGTLCVCSKTR
jgi:hypothetical protein